jgi:hypothetical protein
MKTESPWSGEPRANDEGGLEAPKFILLGSEHHCETYGKLSLGATSPNSYLVIVRDRYGATGV